MAQNTHTVRATMQTRRAKSVHAVDEPMLTKLHVLEARANDARQSNILESVFRWGVFNAGEALTPARSTGST